LSKENSDEIGGPEGEGTWRGMMADVRGNGEKWGIKRIESVMEIEIEIGENDSDFKSRQRWICGWLK
jgi:hypothetical protein